MKKRVGVLGLMVLTVILFCIPDRLSEQTPDKSENKQYTAASIPSSGIAGIKIVSSATDARSEIPVTVKPIISVQTDELSAAAQECLDVMADPVEDDVQIEPYESDITITAPEPPPQPSSSRLPGFDYVPFAGPNIMIKAEDMYENGNKIGTMGDINKQVGIMD